MKKTMMYLFGLIAMLFVATAAGAKNLNNVTDVVFTCDSNPKDFDGKTFENLYVFLKGCKNFNSTIIPGDDAFVTFRDIVVTDTLYYTDDTYNNETNSYKDDEILQNVTYAHSYLNLAGNSRINKMNIKCTGTHTCSLGLQYPSAINDLYLYPVNQWRSNIILRGYIDPLVDENTDYYKDYKVASFPEFSDIDTFIDKMVSDAVFREWKYDDFITYNSSNYVYYSLRGNENKVYEVSGNYQNMFNRGIIKRLHIYNTYLRNRGETVIDFAHIQCDLVNIIDGFYQDSKFTGTENSSWKPVLRSTGYSSVGTVFLYAPYLKLDARVAPINQNVARFMPLHVDAIIADTDGKKVDIEVGYAKIAVADSFTGISSNGSLNLKFNNANTYSREPNLFSQVGTLFIHGGEITLAQQRGYDSPSIGKIILLHGRKDASMKTDDPEKFVNELWKKAVASGKEFIPKNADLPEEAFEYNDFFSYGNKELKNVVNIGKNTSSYYYWSTFVWDNYINNIPEKEENAPLVKVHANKITVGEGYTNTEWEYDGFCYGMVPFDNPSGTVRFKSIVR